MAERDSQGRFLPGNKVGELSRGVSRITNLKFQSLTKDLLDGLDINIALEYIKNFEPKDYVYCMMKLIEIDNNYQSRFQRIELDREKMVLGLTELDGEGETINITFKDVESDLNDADEPNNDEV